MGLAILKNILEISIKDEGVHILQSNSYLSVSPGYAYKEAFIRIFGADLQLKFGNSLIHNPLTSITRKTNILRNSHTRKYYTTKTNQLELPIQNR